MDGRWIAMLQGGLLALLSIAIVLVVCETALRLLHPRYQAAASPPPIARPAEPRQRGVWATYHRGWHPDTGVEHLIVYNNLGGRQSRSFSAASLDSAVNIAFFGDSQTDNNHMPAQYSFTESLDHLLNTHPAASRSEPFPTFNVLNFGASNSGTGLSWLRWRRLPARRELAHVFYMLWTNDLHDLGKSLSRGYVRIDVSGEMLEGGVPHSPLWKRMLARLHLTYLAIDAWHRLAPNFGRPAGDFGADAGNAAREGRDTTEAQTLRVFRELLRSWKREVEADGAAFHVVLLPSPVSVAGWISNDEALREELQVLDLRDCFAAADPPFDYRKWQFATDGHWNPAANMVAARCLYHYLEGVLDLPERSNKDLADTHHAYYRAFLESSVWQGERYVPDTAWARPVAARDDGAALDSSDLPDPHSGSAIVGKYLALELSWSVGGAWMSPKEDRWLEAVSAAREAGVLATSVWDVYAHSAATAAPRVLVYVKRPCPADFRPVGHFFLHVVPFTPEKLHAERTNASSDFVNLDRLPHSPMRRHGGECVFSVPLPDYPLSAVRTGRYTTVGEGVDVVYRELWSMRFQMRLAHSVWDLYASARGRALDYVKSPCGPADTEARFFLHVFPLQSADLRDLPVAGVLRRYANLDFEWGENGLRTDGACRISVALPDFPIAFVRTGQFRDGVLSSKRLWSARIDFDEVERAGES